MIKDKLENCSIYYNISQNLKNGFEWLKSNNLDELNPEQYIIDGARLYANVQEYYTKDNADFETHKKYIDIQCMIKGTEKIGYCNKTDCTSVKNYNSEKDIEFLTCKNEDWINLKEGEFAVFFPNDAHKPSIKIKDKDFVKKVVVKVLID